MSIEFNIHNNQLYGHSTIVRIGTNNESVPLREIADELNRIKAELNTGRPLYHAVKELENAVEKEDRHKIRTVIKQYAKEFALPFFVNTASGILVEFIKSFGI